MPGKNELEPLEVMLQRRVGELQRQNDLMRRLGTTQGFIQAWFDTLKDAETHEAAFHSVNAQYFEIWGVDRYASYNAFRVQKNYYLKKNKQ